MEKFEGTVADVIFSNDLNGYTVAKIKTEEFTEVITGIMPGLATGENIEVEGSWIVHDIYGRQFNVSSYQVVVPSTISGIMSFLSSGVIKGIGEKMAEKIVDKFGIQTLEVIQKNPERLLEVEGIGKKKLGPIVESYNENMGVKNVIISLSPYGISPKLSMKIFKKYGSNSLEIVRTNPYQLIDDIVGIGFKVADEIAKQCGIDRDSKYRIEQGILHVLKNSINSGHTFLPENIVTREAVSLLGISEEEVEEALFELALSRKVVLERYGEINIVYMSKYHRAELDVCMGLISLSNSEQRDVKIDIETELEEFQETEGIYLAAAQKQAVRAAFENGVMVLTGGPGTGKTTTINTIIRLFKINKNKVVLAAPTGRAAKRMTETTGEEAKTIHRLLEMAFDSDDRLIFTKNEEEPINADVIIVDEASMIYF